MNNLLKIKTFLFLLSAGWFTAVGIAAEPIAVWKDFTGLTAETPLAPTSSATVNGVDGSLWRFNLAGGSVSDGALTTGTASAPNIAFGNTINVGYNNKVMTVLLKLQVPVTSVDGAPFVHLGNGTNGIGLASTDANKVCGAWNNTYWNKDANTGTIDALAAAESGEIYLAVSPCSDGLSFAVVTYEMESLAWTVIASGLKGNPINATQITFGNYVNSTSGGLNYTLKGVAVLSGKATLDEMKGAIRTIEGIQIAEVTRELSGSESWSDADWTPSAPTAGSNVTLTVASESTLTMDAAASVVGLTVAGDASLTIATTDSNKLTASTTAINADTTVEAGAASLGAVTIAGGKTLTVKNGYFTNSDNISNGSKLAGAGTIALDLGAGNGLTLYGNGAGTFSGAVDILSGTLTITGAGGSGFLTGRTVNVLDGAAVTIGGDNATGHGNTPANSILHIQQGGTVNFSARNSFKSTLKLTGGTVNLTGGDNAVGGIKRTLDWMSGGDYLQVAALEDATAETPTVSTISQINACGLALRSALGIVVEEKAKLVIEAPIVDVSAGAVTKKGLGVLELAGQNTSSHDLTVEAGQMILSGAWAGALSVNAEAMLTYTTDIAPTNTLTNNGTIAADGEGTEVDLTGATLSGSGTYAVTNGATLILPLAQTAGKTIEVAEGATLQVELTAVEQLSAQVVTITGTGTVQFVDAGGNVLAEAEGSSAEDSTYTPAIPEYTYTLNGEGTGTWNAAPTAGAKITIAFGETEDQTVDLTAVLGEVASVAELIVTGTNGGSITKTGNGSLIIGEFCPETDVTIDGNILSSCVTAQSTITVPETKTLSITVADGGSEWDCALKQSFAGTGVVKKIGAGSLSLLDAYTDFTCPQMIVEEGAFRMASGNTFANYANDYAITVNRNAKFMLGYNAALTGNTTITLNDGAAIECKNGNHSTVSTAAIVVNGNATIKGSLYGDETTFSGGVSGNGTLTLEKISTDNNPLKFSGVIADGAEGTLKVVVNHPGGIVFSGANTYTGGTDIATGAKLTITNAGALGTGAITGAGELICDGVLPTNMTGLTDAANWTGTLALVSTPAQADIAFNSLGNASSTVRLQDYTGSLSNKTAATCYTPNLEIKGTNTINAATEYAIPIFQGDVSGDGTIVFSADKNTNYLFSGDFSAFTGTMELTHTSPKVAIGAASNTNWNAWNPIVNNGQGNITIATAATLNGTFRAVSGVETTSSAILSGNGTIDSALTLTANATIDASATLLTVTGAVTLPSAMKVKIAEAPAVGTAVPLLNAANVTIPEGMTVTVMVGDEADATNTYQLVATPTALLLDNVPAEDVTIEGSSLDASKNWETGQTGEGNYNGIQIDLDAATPFAPGWTTGMLYPLTQFSIMERSDTNKGSIAAGVKVQVYDVAASTVIATSEAWTEKVATSLVANNGTSSYQLCKFPFAEPVWLDASKTYQFRFVTTEGGAASCGLRVLDTEDSNQRNANLLDANYNLTGTNWLPLYTLTAERIVDNSPIVSGGDEVLAVATVPETIHLNTATFGYGTHTVLQYTGGTTDWAGMSVEGLPDGAEIITTDTTWGFAIKTLNVLTVGDSITAGLVTYHNSSANWHVPGGYRLPLYKYLTRAGYSVKYLGSSDVFGTSSVGGNNANEANPSPSLGDNDHHEGHSGITLVTMLDRFNNANVQNEIASQGTPDVITLHLGTNDIMSVGDNTTDDEISADAEKVLTRMQNLLNRLQELYPNTKILVAKIIARSGNKNKVVTEFNKKLNTFFASNQEENLILVDLDINSVSYGLLRYDGLHPSTEGYTQMARGWFNAIEAEFDPLGDSMEAPTPATSTPMEDVTGSDRTVDTVGMAGVLKAAEWTTFTDFETGYLSQFGYMPDSERPWQLDVRGANAPTVSNGVLSLNGAPITVNPVDGRLGTTMSTYTIVMKVSDLAANDVIFTDSSVRNDDWPENVNTNYKGTTNADLGKLTVVDADTLQWTYNGLENGPTIDLTGVNLTDSTPDVIAITVTCNQCKVAVNGGAAVTVSQGSASESYRGSWSIGALSTADTGSSMKLYRLSFYEGAATLPPPPSVVVNVGEYASWNAALEAGVVSATMSATTLHFTADDQIFTFDNTGSVRLGVVTVTAEAGVTGGTIALGDTAEVTSSSLALQTNVTAPAAFYNGCAGTVTAASAETVVAVNDAAEVSLTATIQGGILKQAGTGTVTFTPGAWGSTQTPAKFEVADGTLAFGKSTTGWNNPPALVVSGGTLNLNNVYTFADNASGYLTTASPVLTMGGATATTIQGGAITPYTTGATEQMIVRYLGNDGTNAPATFAANIHSVYTNSARTRSIEVGKGAQSDGYDLEVTGTIGLSGGEYNAATLKKSGAGILKLSNTNNFPTLEVTEGTLWSNHADALGATTTVKTGATLVGSGTVATAFTLEAGATLDVTKGVVTANGSVTLPNALNVIVDSLPTDETPVVILNTTAFAAAEGVAETVVTVNEAVSGYILYKTASAVELRVAPFEAVANPVIAANEVASWTAFMAQLTANKQTVAENAVLTIDFGNGETPGSFTFDNDETLALGEVIVIGSAGGTITKTGEAVTTASLTVNTSATLTDGAVEATDTVTIAEDCALTYNQTTFTSELTTTATYTGNGKLNLTGSGSLELTKPCNVDVAVSGGASLCVNVPTTDANSAAQKAFADRVNVTTTAEALLELKQGLAFCEINAAGWVQVTGAYTLGFGGDGAGSFAADILYVSEGATLTTRAWRAYELTATSAIWVDGAIANDPQGSVRPTVKVVSGSTLSTYYAAGTLELDVTIAEGGLIEAGDLTVNGSITYPDTLKVALTELPTDENPVKVLNTTAFADATGYDWETEVTVIFTDELDHQETFVGQYLLYKTETALELRPLMEVTEATASGEVDRWSEVLNQLSAEGKRLATSGATLTIDFGDKPQDGEATPGIFTFDLANESVLTLAAVQIQGTNGGTIAKEGEGVSISVGATSIAENVAVNVTAGAMELGTTTIAAGAEVTLNDTAALGTTDAASVANKVTGAGTLVLNGALPAGLANGSAGKLVAEEWTGTVKVVNVDNRNLDLGDLVRPGSSLALNNVKAYIYDCAMASLTLEGDFQQNNGTSERPKTQCVTIDTLTGSGALIGPDNAPYCTAYNVKAVENFTGAIDLSHTNAKNTIFFFGVAPERFTNSITEGNVGASDGDFTDEDYGTLYTTIALTVPAGKTWAAKGFVVEDGGSLAIAGWCDPGSRLVQNGSGAATVENGGVLDLRGLDNLSGISVTVKAGGRVLVKSGATVPDSIVFEAEAILGIVPASVDDIGSATLTVTAEGTAKTTATKKGYKTDGVTELGNWTDKEDADPDDNTLSFGYDPIFDGELCWWAYEFDNEVNTTEESNLGPISTGRDKTRMTFDSRGNSNRHCEGNEYVVTSTDNEGNPVTKAIRLASGAYRSATWPEAGFTAAAYGRLTPNPNRVLFAFGQTNSKNPTIALATGASANAVQLVLIAGREDATTPWTPDVDTPYASPITVLAETTVPNATTEDHLFAFSYELKDTDDDGTKDTTEIVFYVDGDKYQPYKVNKVLTIGGGFQMGTTFGGVPDQYLTRMNEGDAAATIEFLRVYDEVLPEATFTAMANAYPYISKVGRATRTIVAGADTTWHEAGEWSQVKVVDGVPQEPVAQDKPDFGTIAEPEIGTQVFLNVDGENTLYLNEFYSTPLQEGETSKLYYERLEINDVAGGDEDSLTMWAGRLNENEDPAYKDSQSAVLTVLGYTKINTNVTFAHNVAYLSGPVAVAEGKYLHFDFSGFDVMKVPSMPVTYRLTGFLDEETRSRVTSTAPADPVNARSIDLGYKTDVNQYTFTVNRYPVTAYFTADDDPMMAAFANNPAIDFNTLSYIWQGNELGKTMNWDAEAVDPQGNPIVENTLAKFVSLDAETQQEKIVTVSLATTDADPITLTLAEAALSKETTPAGQDTEAVVEPMLGEQQLIIGNKVIVDYSGDPLALAPVLNGASAETSGVVRAQGFDTNGITWRANLSVKSGTLAGTGEVSGKLTFEEGTTLDATAATADARLTVADGDFTNLKAITVDYEVVKAAGATGFKVLALAEGHTAESLTGCTVTAVKDDATTVIWTENGNEPTLVVVREDGLYVVARPDVVVTVEAADTVIDNNNLTLPLARRAAELGAQKLTLTAVTNVKGDTLEVSIADAATLFTGVASAEDVTGDAGGATATLAYDFGITAINVVGGGEALVMQVVLSNTADLEQNTAAFAEGVSVGISCDGEAVEATEVADIEGTEGSNSGNIRYLKIAMPEEVKTHKFKARATK